MKNSVKLISVLLIIVTLLSSVSCGEKVMPEKQIIQNVYKSESFALPEGMNNANSLFETDDGYIVYGQVNDENGEYNNRFARLDKNFALIEYFDVDLGLGADTWFGDIVFASDGTAYLTASSNYYDEETDYYESKNYFIHLDSEYKVINMMLTNELLGLAPEEYAYIYGITPLSDGSIAFISNDTVYTIDSEMNITLKKSSEDLNANYINTILDTPKGVVVVYSDQNYDNKAVILDPVSKSFSAPYDFSQLGYGQYYGGSGDYDIYYTSDNGIGGYSFETGEGVELLNYMNSDLNNFYPNELIAGDNNTFICTTWNYDDTSDDGMKIIRLSPVPDEEKEPKYIITLGALYLNYNIRNYIYKFNRSNDEYRIVLKDYSADIDYSEESEYTYEDAITKINSDIAAGNVPDLFVCSSELPFDSYASKGLFIDLYKYMDADENYSRDKFEQNILSAFETDEKLYRIPATYNVQGFGGLKRVIGDYAENWNMDSFMALANSLDENVVMFRDITRDNLLEVMLSSMYDEFIDVASGKCSFNDGAFASILEYASTLGETTIFDDMDWDKVEDNFWEEYENAIAEGKVALSSAYFGSFDDYISLINYTFRTDEIALVGYPGASGSPVIYDSSSAISISSKSKLKDGAWAFIASLLSEDFQDSLDWNFPVRTSSLEKMMKNQIEESQKRKKEEEEASGGETPLVAETYASPKMLGVADSTYEYGNYYLDENYANIVLEFIRSADMISHSDSEITKIVKEEAGRFFEGQCTSDQAAEAVQSRVSIYVSENS